MLDLDGVVANFAYSFQKFLNENYGCSFNPLKDPTKYSFENWGHGVDKIDLDAASSAWMNNNGFSGLPSYTGAEEFVTNLMDNYDVYIVTARVGDWDQKLSKTTKDIIKKNTYDWLQDRGIPANRLYFAHDKIPFCKEHQISVIVEDKLETALKAAKEGIHTVLIDRGYNQSKSERLRVYRVYNFNEALSQLKKLIQ